MVNNCIIHSICLRCYIKSHPNSLIFTRMKFLNCVDCCTLSFECASVKCASRARGSWIFRISAPLHSHHNPFWAWRCNKKNVPVFSLSLLLKMKKGLPDVPHTIANECLLPRSFAARLLHTKQSSLSSVSCHTCAPFLYLSRSIAHVYYAGSFDVGGASPVICSCRTPRRWRT